MSRKEKVGTKKIVKSGYTFMAGKSPAPTRYTTLSEVRTAYIKGKSPALKKVVYVSMYGTVKPVGWIWKGQGVYWWSSYGNGKLGSTPARPITKKGELKNVVEL